MTVSFGAGPSHLCFVHSYAVLILPSSPTLSVPKCSKMYKCADNDIKKRIESDEYMAVKFA